MAESQMVCERKNSPGNGIGRDQSGNRIGMACTESSRSPAETGNKKAGLETNWHNLGTGQTGLGNIGLGLSHVTPPVTDRGLVTDVLKCMVPERPEEVTKSIHAPRN